MWWLVSKLLLRAMMIAKSAGALGVGGVITDALNLDLLRRESIKLAPGSDPEAHEEAARAAARLLNLEGDEVLWPVDRNGEAIIPHYMTIDLVRGRAWYSKRHYSRKSVNAGGRRGYSRGRRGGRSEMVQNKTISG